MFDLVITPILEEYFPRVLADVICQYQSENPLLVTIKDITLSCNHYIVNAASSRERQCITMPDAGGLTGKQYIILNTMPIGSVEIKLNAKTSRFIPSPHQYVSLISDGDEWLEV